jgi:hypothetical protein
MFDDLRQQASFEDGQEEAPAEEEFVTQDSPQVARRGASFSLQADSFLGMTAVQRFVIAVMMMIMTCLLGTLFLLVTLKIWPPFL